MSPDRGLLGRLPEGGSAGDLFGQICILAALAKALAERGLSTQMDVHLDEERGEKALEAAQPARQSAQRQPPEDSVPDSDKVALDIPRDQNGTFDPMLITKYRRRLPGFDRKIASMHVRGDDDPQDPGASRGDPWCRGLARPDFRDHRRGHRRDHRRDHGGGHRQARPPGPLLSDRLHGRDRGRYPDRRAAANKAVFVALAVLPDGTRDVPGPWFHANEGARFRARVLSELRNPIVGKQSPGSFPDPPHTFQRSRSPSWTG